MQIHFEFRQCAGLRGDNQTTLSFVIANHASSSLTSDRLPFDVPHMCWNEFMTADLAAAKVPRKPTYKSPLDQQEHCLELIENPIIVPHSLGRQEVSIALDGSNQRGRGGHSSSFIALGCVHSQTLIR